MSGLASHNHINHEVPEEDDEDRQAGGIPLSTDTISGPNENSYTMPDALPFGEGMPVAFSDTAFPDPEAASDLSGTLQAMTAVSDNIHLPAHPTTGPVPQDSWDELMVSSPWSWWEGATSAPPPAFQPPLTSMLDAQFVVDYSGYSNDVLGWLHTWTHSTKSRSLVALDRFMTQRRKLTLWSDVDTNNDIQGLDWTQLQTNKRDVLNARWRLYSTASESRRVRGYPRGNQDGKFFRFRRTTDHSIFLPHYQLRHLITAPSRNDIFYASGKRILQADCTAQPARTTMDLTSNRFTVTTIAATPSVLVAGGFNGEYAYVPLTSHDKTPPTIGNVDDTQTHITNHVSIYTSRSLPPSSPIAALSSNNRTIRLLSTSTNTFLTTHTFPHAINASATSPDARLRALVGDSTSPLITDADRGTVLIELSSHHLDHCFSVAWSDDGISVATGGQDNLTFVWDARFWTKPVARLNSHMACPRALAFSPLGGGRRVLCIAEADDVVGVVDAVTWEERQDLEFFGAVGGMAVAPDGREIWVANCDPKVGGILEFERLGVKRGKGLGLGEVLV
ncbi:MAG: hypothetical protein M1820_002921 [Bogoriella megaspora]|nr:MAG: hypothetical protein M1820_002921 [Bogoriella megaspora]